MTSELQGLILSGILALVAVHFVVYVIGYTRGKKFAILMAKRELRALGLCKRGQPQLKCGWGGAPSAAAKVIGAIRGQPSDWAQQELDKEPKDA